VKKLLAMGLCVLITLHLLGCISSKESNNRQISDEEIIIGMVGGPHGFHPWMMSYDVDTMAVNGNIFNCLIEFDTNFKIIPALAKSWNNPNDNTWRFNLREGVKFHNGNNFTAEDVKFTINLIKSDNASVIRELVAGITDVVVIDDLTVDIITEKPCPILLNKLIDVFIVSKEYHTQNKSDWPIGTGAYKLVDYEMNGYVFLERFDDYWKGPPLIKRVIFKSIEEYEDRKSALYNGTIDISGIHPTDFEQLQLKNGIEPVTATAPTVMYLGFDFRENGSSYIYSEENPLINVNIRKAIYHAINISYIIKERLNDFASPASQFVSPLIFGYNPSISRLPFDLETARLLMEKSDFPDGFELDINCFNSTNTIELCNDIADMLAEINITLHIKPLGIDNYYPTLCDGNSPFFIVGWQTSSADGGEIFDFCLRSNNGTKTSSSYNYGYYSNPDIDEIGLKVASTMDPKLRLALMQEGFLIAMDDVAWIPLYTPVALYGCNNIFDWNPGNCADYCIEKIGFK